MKSKINDLKSFGKNFQVLYVEDNSDARAQTQKMLNNFFSNVTLAIDGQDGLNKYLEYYKKSDSNYDLVITDINMPNMDGLKMSSEIIKKNSSQSIIITTAHNEIEFLTEAINIGVTGFITKPIKNIQFIDTLHRASIAVSDRKFVEEHVQQMEEMAIKLEEQYQEAITKNIQLEQSLRVIDTMIHKEQITHPKKIELTQEDAERDNSIKEQIEYLINEDLHELIEIHSEIDIVIIDILGNIDNIEQEILSKLVKKFNKYSSILSHYSFFTELSREMFNFTNTLQNEKLPDDTESVKNIFMLLESFIYVLGKWQDDLASGDESKINALDASITSDMKTISNMWSQEEGELQDIFDF